MQKLDKLGITIDPSMLPKCLTLLQPFIQPLLEDFSKKDNELRKLQKCTKNTKKINDQYKVRHFMNDHMINEE